MLTVYLDQNKWIDLAKAEAGKPDGRRFLPVLAAIRKATHGNKAVFPISFPHLHETARAPKSSQRKQLALLMTEFSQGVVLRTPQQLITEELRHAVRRLFAEPAIPHSLSPFGRGIEAAVNFNIETHTGMTAARAERLRRRLDSPDAWIDLLSYSTDEWRTKTITGLNRIGNKAAFAHEEDRDLLQDSNEMEVRRIFAARTTLHFIDQIKAALLEIGRTFEEWGSSGPDQLLEFWSSIPCVRVHMELEIALHHNKSKKWTRNDLADLNFLGIAIPYCDAVVTERFWIHNATRVGLEHMFRTALFSDLADLEPFLTSR